MRTNTARRSVVGTIRTPVRTAQGAPAEMQAVEDELRRVVGSCMLFEDIHYTKGVEVAERIRTLAVATDPDVVAGIAIETRKLLRHAPLWLALTLLGRNYDKTAETIAAVCQRADDMTEIVAMYWHLNKDRVQTLKRGKGFQGRQHFTTVIKQAPLANQLKRGLAMAFPKFNAYQLAKYDREGTEVRLRDVYFLTHPLAAADRETRGRLVIWKQLIADTKGKLRARPLPTPDTWETALSAGKDARKTWERLIAEGKLGTIALLRNLRNMEQAGVKAATISNALEAASVERVLPHQFVAAATACPGFEGELEALMFRNLAEYDKLDGDTLLIDDTSGSMDHAISAKSEMTRLDAAAQLTMMVREICARVTVYATAGNDRTREHATMKMPSRRGFALRDALKATHHTAENSLGGGGIFLVQCLRYIKEQEHNKKFARVIVFTDEVDCDRKLNAKDAPILGRENYLVNVSSEAAVLPLADDWHRVNGFSDKLVDYIRYAEMPRGKFKERALQAKASRGRLN